MPERIQLSRAKGWRLPPNTVKVDRSTRWGNPFVIAPDVEPGTVIDQRKGLIAAESHQASIDAYRKWIETTPEGAAVAREARKRLAGFNLACWCKPDQACHADVLLEIANS